MYNMWQCVSTESKQETEDEPPNYETVNIKRSVGFHLCNIFAATSVCMGQKSYTSMSYADGICPNSQLFSLKKVRGLVRTLQMYNFTKVKPSMIYTQYLSYIKSTKGLLLNFVLQVHSIIFRSLFQIL